MTADAEHQDGVIVLGVCEHAAFVPEGGTNLGKWNILGLKPVLLSHVFPMTLGGVTLVAGVSASALRDEFELRLLDPAGRDVGFLRFGTAPLPGESEHSRPVGPAALWSPVFLPIEAGSPIVIAEPGAYAVSLVEGEHRRPIGVIDFVLVDPPPLTPDRVAAIRSDPGASKEVRLTLGCRRCDATARAYAALERRSESEHEGWVWFADMPEEFRCDCGETTISLESVRRNLHGLLGQRHLQGEIVRFIPLYEQGTLSKVRAEYSQLLTTSKREEDLQDFIEANPVLLHQFPSERLFAKPPILTYFVADFAIVTPMRELVLVELERADTRLMRADGHVAAPLSHAVNQVTDWLQVVDEHRLAVFESLGIEKDHVSSVRGVVIAGRDAGYEALHLRRLKGVDRGRVSLLTYDDLLLSLDALIRRFEEI